jgi:hypothetical protein
VIVPCPVGGYDEIARLHGRALTIDGGVGTAAFDNEAQRGLAVAVCGRDLARQDQLQPGIKALRQTGPTRKAGIFKDQHAPYGLFGCNKRPGLHQFWPHIAIIIEQHGLDHRRRLRRNKAMQHFPQGRHAQRFQRFIITFAIAHILTKTD